MKKLISVMTAFVILIMCVTPVAYAAEVTAIVEISDSKLGTIAISDSFAVTDAGEKINVLVLNPGYTVSDAETNSAAIQYQDVIQVQDNGKAEGEFMLLLPLGFTEGTFTVRIGGSAYDGATKEYAVYYLPFAEQVTLAQALYNKIMAYDASNETAKNAAITMLTSSKDGLAYGTNSFNAVDAEAVTVSLKKYWTANPVSFGVTDDEKEAAVKSIQERIKINSVVRAFNEGKSEVLYNTQKNIIDSTLLKLSEKLASTSVEELFTKLTDAGKANVNSGMLGKNLADENELAKLYARLVITNAVTNNKTLGSAVVTEALVNANVSYAGYSVPNYQLLGDKTSANTLIIQNKSEITVDNLAEVVEKYAKQSIAQGGNVPPAITGGGAGGGGGGGSSISHASSAAGGPIAGAIEPQKPVSAFNDIAGYKWAEQAINYLAANGIISGTGNNKFEPEANLTREQAVKIICLALDIELVKAATLFDDEEENAWYNDFIATARNKGFVKGKSDAVFGIGESISRQDFTVMVYRALESPEVGESAAEFSDNAYIDNYAGDAVKYFKENRIINGYEDGSFKPLNTITRAEAAQLIYSIISR